MKQQMIWAIVVTVGIAGVGGFLGGSLLTRTDREKTKQQIKSIQKIADEQLGIYQYKTKKLQNNLNDEKQKNIEWQSQNASLKYDLEKTRDSLADANSQIIKLQTELKSQISQPNLINSEELNISISKSDEKYASVIKKISKPIFGIDLGESLDELQKRFQTEKILSSKDTDLGDEWWNITQTLQGIQNCGVISIDNKIASIFLFFTDASLLNFEAISAEIEKTYNIKSESTFELDPAKKYSTVIDGINVEIDLKLEKNFGKPDQLALFYYHLPLMRKFEKDIKKQKISPMTGRF